MAETPDTASPSSPAPAHTSSHEIRRELALTREMMGDTLTALDRKLNPKYIIEEHPLTALGVAFGAGVLLGMGGVDTQPIRAVRTQVRTQLRNNAARLRTTTGNNVEQLVHGTVQAILGTAVAKLTSAMEQMVARLGAGAEAEEPAETAPFPPGTRWQTQPGGRRW